MTDAATRLIAISDTKNFRHMGGYAAQDGRVTRSDRLFRTGWFKLLSPADGDRLAAIDVSRIFDFRNESERANSPLELPPAPGREIVSLGIDRGSMGLYLDRLTTLTAETADTKGAMTQMFHEMLDEGRQQFTTFLAEASKVAGPVMVMCTLGKDRTGVAAALLLSALGVSKADIIDDFMISATAYADYAETFAERARFAERGIDLELVGDMLTVHPDYLEALWQRADEIAGGMDGVLTDYLGLSPADRNRLVANLTA